MIVKYILPEELREDLAKPVGIVFDGHGIAAKKVITYLRENPTQFLITIGDVTTRQLIAYGRFPNMCILDGYTKRGEYRTYWDWSGVIKMRAENPAATITENAILTIESMLKELIENRKTLTPNRGLIYIEGEEDLLVLPCIKLAPNGAVVLYGLPDVGIVLLKVDETTKQLAEEMLEKMKVEE